MSKKTHRKYLFFFSSRRRHTISDRDWSSDVCSSDLPLTGAAFPGNQIPASRISPIARAILANTALYPLPNRSVNGVSGNFVGDALTTIRARQGDARVDWNTSAKDKVFARFSFAEYESRNDKRPFPLLLGSLTDSPFRNVAFNWNRIFSGSLV